mmetsp:Transcript_28279/g.27219  ORF Transcript_28279/g.27219 Transcript_28279/m.27219 type:complete len:96 (-) Transcript_28279:350-637(-)
MQKANIVDILQRLKDQLNKRGSTTIRGLGRSFRTMDSIDGNRKVTFEEFFTGIKDFGVEISKAEAEVLMAYFDQNNDGVLNFDEFLVGIRGKLNP